MIKRESLVAALLLLLQNFALAQESDDCSAIWDPAPPSRETHACYAESDNLHLCDEPEFYYNWLACHCFAKDSTCEETICDEGESHDPFEPCGMCLPDEMIRSLYPDWATDDEISESVEDGIKRVEARPDDWRLCELEVTPDECSDD